MADVSHGWTIVFGTTGYAPDVTDIQPPGAERESLETSHQGTSVHRTYTPGDLVDCGEMVLSGHYDLEDDPPIEDVTESITMTAPDGGTIVFDGFMTNWQPDAPHGQIMTFTATVKVTGPPVVDPAGTGAGEGSYEL